MSYIMSLPTVSSRPRIFDWTANLLNTEESQPLVDKKKRQKQNSRRLETT